MVLNESLFISKDTMEYPGCLIDNAGVGNGINDALEVVLQSMFERECKARQRFPSACWHSQAEKSRCQVGRAQATLVDLGAYGVERTLLDMRKFLLIPYCKLFP